MLNKIVSLLVFLLIPYSAAYGSSKVYRINSQNTVVVNSEINEESYFRFSEDLHNIKQKRVLVYIDSLGGSVLAGSQMIHVALSLKKANKIKYTCIIQNAASMAFALVQSICDVRVISPTSVLMQHQMAFGTFGQIERISSLVKMVRDLETYLNFVQAKRLGLKVNEFKSKITNDWFLVGSDAIKHKAADAFGYWVCSEPKNCPLLKSTP